MNIDLGWLWAPIGFVVETVLMVVFWAWYHPVRGAAWVLIGVSVWVLGPHDALAVWLWLIVAGLAWWAVAMVSSFFRRPRRRWARWVERWLSWERWVGSWWRPFWRSWRVYNFNDWADVCKESWLTIVRDHAIDEVPRRLRVFVGPFGDTVRVKMLSAQTVDMYEVKAPGFADSFGAQSCRAFPAYTAPGRVPRPGIIDLPDGRRKLIIGKHPGGVRIPGQVDLEFATKDVLSENIDPIPIPASSADVDFGAVPIGKTEGGDRWTLKVHGSHILIAGLTGSGKGSVLWGILKGLAPAIRDGLVRVWAIDPKGGMELYQGRGLYTRYCDGSPADMAAMLGDLATVVLDRTQKYKVSQRDHVPTLAEPMILCLIDEFASILTPRSNSKADKDVAAEANQAATLIVNMGRAVGVSLVGALQNPRKEVVNMRDEIPEVIALRLKSARYTDMIFWPGASASGIRCDRILRTQPGRGFAWSDEKRAIIAVRSAYVPDEEIRELAATYGPTGVLDEIEHGASGG